MTYPDTLESSDLKSHIASLVLHHRQKWLRFVLRVVQDYEDAEDVLQEAIQRVLARNRVFGSEDETRMYLGRAISNTAIELYHSRRRERKRRIPINDEVATILEPTDPHVVLEARELSREQTLLIRHLQEGLTRLPANQYEALRMTILQPEAVSIREAGSRHGIPYSTLRHRSMQALRSLRRYLRKATKSAETVTGPSTRQR